MEDKRLLSTSYIKAVAIAFIIINHTLIYACPDNTGYYSQRYLFNFWVYQAVSLFLVVTGIHFAKSMVKLGGGWKWYDRSVFGRKLWRFLFPFLVSQVVVTLYYVCYRHVRGAKTFLKWSCSGGAGPGGYYTILTLQILILFPILYSLLKKNTLGGMILILLLSVAWELAVRYGVISSAFNRLCVMRVLFAYAVGIVLFIHWEKIADSAIPWIMLGMGLAYLVAITFFGYSLQIVAEWATCSFAAIPYAAGIVCLVIRKEELWQRIWEKNKFTRVCFSVVEYIGRATYHIFLVQQVYFCTDIYQWLGGPWRLAVQSIFDICVCVAIGCAFYAADGKCRMLVRTWRQKKVAA